MAVTAPNLSIDLAVVTGCSGLTLEDTTDNYGLSGGPAIADVVTVTILVTPSIVSTTIEYVFTVAAGVITAATLSLGGATPEDILSALPSTVWPFTDANSNIFDLLGDYGVTLPTFEDDIFTVSYTIEGEVAAEAFSFDCSDYEVVDCQTQYCVDQKLANLDRGCDCYETNRANALLAYTYLLQLRSAVSLASLSDAVTALEQAKLLCDDEDCGCN